MIIIINYYLSYVIIIIKSTKSPQKVNIKKPLTIFAKRSIIDI